MAVIERERTAPPPAAMMGGTRAVAPRWQKPLVTAAQVLLEAGLIALAFVVAYWARYVAEFGGTVEPYNYHPFEDYISYALLLIAAVLFAFGVRGLYRVPRGTTFFNEATSVAAAVTVANAVILVIVFLSPELVSSRAFVVYSWAAVNVALIAARGTRRIVRDQLWQRGKFVERALVVGSGPAAERVISYLASRNDLGLYLVGYVDDGDAPEDWMIATRQRIIRPVHLGGSADLACVVAAGNVAEVVIALPPQAHERIQQVIEVCRAADVRFQLVPDIFELSLGRVQINELNGVPLIMMRDTRIRGWNYYVKRALDLIGATAALVVLGIPMLLIAAAIKLESEGPAILPQTRVGKNGKPFTCYKFRSMRKDADHSKAQLVRQNNVEKRLVKLKDDPRRTKVGRFIRRTSLDELPQLFNVLIGKMSLVGPRPQVPDEVAHYEPWHHQRLDVTPGMTGIWQVAGRSDLTFDEMVRLDIYYAENWSVRLDLEILLRTIPAVLTQRGAY